MSDETKLLEFVATVTALSLENIAEIYHAGAPWPIIYRELEQMAARDAHAAGVPVETAFKALDQLCDLEGKAIVALCEQATRAMQDTVPSWDLPEVQAILDRPLFRDMLYYSRRLALRIGEPDVWTVFYVYLAILIYAWNHPEWDPGDARSPIVSG